MTAAFILQNNWHHFSIHWQKNAISFGFVGKVVAIARNLLHWTENHSGLCNYLSPALGSTYWHVAFETTLSWNEWKSVFWLNIPDKPRCMLNSLLFWAFLSFSVYLDTPDSFTLKQKLINVKEVSTTTSVAGHQLLRVAFRSVHWCNSIMYFYSV